MTTDSAPLTSVRRPPLADRIVAGVLFLLLVFGCAMCTFLGIFLVFVSDSCGTDHDCEPALIGLGMLVTAVLPWLVLIGGIVWAVVRARRQRLVWWVPIVVLLVGAAVAVGGITLAFAGASGNYF
jgi:hypothetical protein